MVDCSLVISTFGDEKWKLLAHQRALPNAHSLGVPVIYNHGDTLHGARNEGLSQVETEHVAFLDADDELHPSFLEEIEKFEGDIRVPAIQYVPYPARMPNVVGHHHLCHSDCLLWGNFIVVGAVARTQLVRDVGGWRDYPIFEDYDLWMRCWLAGASIVTVPSAIYVAHSTAMGRNKSLSVRESRMVQYQIATTNMPEGNFEWLK